MFWQLAAFAQGLLALSALTAGCALVTVLIRRGHLRRNPAAVGAAALLFVLGVLSALRVAYLSLPVGLDLTAGDELRRSYDGLLAGWDVATAVVAVVVLTRRKLWDALLSPPARTQASEGLRSTASRLNDDVAQKLAQARHALDVGDAPRARAAMDTALEASRAVIADVLGERHRVIHLDPEPTQDDAPGPRTISLARPSAPRVPR